MAGLTHSTFVTSIAKLLPVSASDAGFTAVLPNIIDDAELRLYRELHLLDTSTRTTGTLTAGSRNFTLPSTNGTAIVTDELNVITPAGTTNPDSGTRNQLVPCSDEMLNMMWPSSSGSTVPAYFACCSPAVFDVDCWQLS